MKKKCYDGLCYHCKVEVSTKNKQFCPECFENYNELFDEFQEFYENEAEDTLRITRVKHFKASTRSYIRDYLKSDADGVPVNLYMNLHGLTEEYIEKINIVNFSIYYDTMLSAKELGYSVRSFHDFVIWDFDMMERQPEPVEIDWKPTYSVSPLLMGETTYKNMGKNFIKGNNKEQQIQEINDRTNYTKLTKPKWQR